MSYNDLYEDIVTDDDGDDDGGYDDGDDGDDGDDSDQRFQPDEKQYVVGYNDMEHMGVGGHQHIGDESTKDPLDRKKGRVAYISKLLEEQVTQEDINIMCEMLESIDVEVMKKLNPSALVLGYIASNGGMGINGELSVKRVKMSFGLINKISDEGLSSPDIVRYARYWMNVRN
jgi:hypothetical protein